MNSIRWLIDWMKGATAEEMLPQEMKQEMAHTGRIRNYVLRIGEWKAGQIITLAVSKRQYKVQANGEWRRLGLL